MRKELLLMLCVAPSAGQGAAAPPAAPDAIVACDAKALIADQDPKGLNVRAGPGAKQKVVANLAGADWVVITGSQGPWIRISQASADDEVRDLEQTVFSGEGWVYGPLLGVDGVGGETPGTPLRAEPSNTARVLVRMQPDDGGAVLQGCRANWLLLQHRPLQSKKSLRGWARSNEVCIATRSTCS